MSILVNNLRGNKTKETPVWFMRQAGRHLPEYHELKSKYNSLLDMFLNKDAIVEATLQPLLRYEIDAAIIFSDILMVPYIMGGTPTFENSGTGPTVKIDFQEKLFLKINFNCRSCTRIFKCRGSTHYIRNH